VNDGTICNKRTEIACINGPARALLSGERTALNLLQHLSGVATLTAQCVEKVKGTKCQILDTRKTVPGLRLLDKYAVRVGGGTNHRLHLGDRILIKNNHLALSKSIGVCIERAKKAYPLQWVEVEVDNLSELEEAIEAGADGALLDNMQPEEVARCVELAQGRLFLEASGGISLENVLEYAKTGVDGVSIGALTHSAPALDISMKIRSKS
jgi:nicotinate-nucleotide pyrophosphorylase (carboxylating)